MKARPFLRSPSKCGGGGNRGREAEAETGAEAGGVVFSDSRVRTFASAAASRMERELTVAVRSVTNRSSLSILSIVGGGSVSMSGFPIALVGMEWKESRLGRRVREGGRLPLVSEYLPLSSGLSEPSEKSEKISA